MGFGAELQGRNSHEALLQLQDAEIKLLETMKKCLNHRIKCDRDYANSLQVMVTHAHKLDGVVLETPAYKAWSMIVTQTEVLAGIIRENADSICTQALEKLVQMINEKRSAKKFYTEEKHRMDNDCNKLQNEVNRLKTDYEHHITKVTQEKAKYEEVKNKGKVGSKLEDAKARYVKAASKLHILHNEYVVCLQETNHHQRNHARVILPALLDYQQEIHVTLSAQSKEIMQDYSIGTDLSSDRIGNCHREIDRSINFLTPHREYDDFLNKHRSDPLQPSKLEFQKSLVDTVSSHLQSGDIVLDDLTESALQSRVDTYRVLWTDYTKRQEDKQAEITQLKQLLASNNQPPSEMDPSTLNTYKVQQRAVALLQKEVKELKCHEEKYKGLYELVHGPLETLGPADAPQGINFGDNSSAQYADKLDAGAGTGHNLLNKMGQAFNKLKQPRQLPATKTQSHTDLNASAESKSSYEDGGTMSGATSPTTSAPIATSRSSAAANGSSPTSPSSNDNHISLNSDQGYQQQEFGQNGQNLDNMTLHPGRPLVEEEWFHGVLPREEVQRLLKNDGDYLVRESKNRKTNEVQYVLSVMWEEHKHFIIQGTEGSWRFEGDNFPTIQELIIAQHKCGQTVTRRSGAVLQTPIMREDWEISNDDIQLGQHIGKGNFGEVFRGVYKLDNMNNMDVAIKTCQDTLSEDMKKKFLQEGRILKQYDHPNIVKFVGIAAQRHPVMIVMEYVAGGSLLNFLRKQGAKQTKKILVKMCEDAASGMAYLEDKNCIHRDLAARNCLVGTKSVVKISDFGMSREEEMYTVSGGLKQIPIKWTAPEALHFGTYTTMCDVWSFGILIWEVFSFGQTPYQGLTNSQAREKVDDGYRMPASEGTPPKVYTLMMKCWEKESKERPHFEEIRSTLSSIHSSVR